MYGTPNPTGCVRDPLARSRSSCGQQKESFCFSWFKKYEVVMHRSTRKYIQKHKHTVKKKEDLSVQGRW